MTKKPESIYVEYASEQGVWCLDVKHLICMAPKSQVIKSCEQLQSELRP